MPKVVRNYERKDFSYLLNELQVTATASKKGEEVEKEENKGQLEEVVDKAHRIRSSKMDNRSMKYAYSLSEKVLHDRECKLAVLIPDKEFEMTGSFIVDMPTCKKCYRMALIRYGIGDDWKRIPCYLKFLNDIWASNKDLKKLIVENGAVLKLLDYNVIQICVKEDTWQIRITEQECELYHNNYIVLEDYTRVFLKNFHKQIIHGKASFSNISELMLRYSWKEHVEKLKVEKELQENLVPIIAELSVKTVVNYYKLKRLFVFYTYFIYYNTGEHIVNQNLEEYKLNAYFSKEYNNQNKDFLFLKKSKK